MKVALLISALMAIASYREPPQERHASFRCTRYQIPKVRCEAHQVWPAMPIWHVYYSGTKEVVDHERGIIVYLTLPVGKYALFEMCYDDGRPCLQAYGGWFDGRLLFHRRGLEEDP